jgi:hypothetical protein
MEAEPGAWIGFDGWYVLQTEVVRLFCSCVISARQASGLQTFPFHYPP